MGRVSCMAKRCWERPITTLTPRDNGLGHTFCAAGAQLISAHSVTLITAFHILCLSHLPTHKHPCHFVFLFCSRTNTVTWGGWKGHLQKSSCSPVYGKAFPTRRALLLLPSPSHFYKDDLLNCQVCYSPNPVLHRSSCSQHKRQFKQLWLVDVMD